MRHSQSNGSEPPRNARSTVDVTDLPSDRLPSFVDGARDGTLYLERKGGRTLLVCE